MISNVTKVNQHVNGVNYTTVLCTYVCEHGCVWSIELFTQGLSTTREHVPTVLYNCGESIHVFLKD